MNTHENFIPTVVPGVYDISNDVYHNSPGISSSGLKLFAQSPLHYWERYLNPRRVVKPDTPALELGKQIHMAVLEPALYFEQYYPLPQKFNRTTKTGKLEYEYHEQQAKDQGKELISRASHDIVQGIAQGVHDSDAADYLFGLMGMVEKSFYWEEPPIGPPVLDATGKPVQVICKVRPDKWLPGVPAILDLKSCEDASPAAFRRAARKYDYALSAAFYLRGIEAVTHIETEAFVICAYEKAAPFASAFYQIGGESLAEASERIDKLLALYAECLAEDRWPGYPMEIQTLETVWIAA